MIDFFELARNQHFPKGALYVIATPIGNLADISIRALHTLTIVDGIACEDKRHTGSLLASYGISKPLFAIHQHNEHEGAATLIEKLKSGERWAYVSDAGTPGISDPGSILVEQAHEHGIPVIPIPGSSALTVAVSASGSLLRNQDGHFQFLGFLPNKQSQRDETLKQIEQATIGTFFYEAPHRIRETLLAITKIFTGARKIQIAKELTKLHENIVVILISELHEWILNNENWQGEFVIGIEAAPQSAPSLFTPEIEAWTKLLEDKIGHKELSEILARQYGLSKKEAYQFLLDRKNSQ